MAECFECHIACNQLCIHDVIIDICIRCHQARIRGKDMIIRIDPSSVVGYSLFHREIILIGLVAAQVYQNWHIISDTVSMAE